MSYVIGIDGGSTKCLLKAKDFDGNTLAELRGDTTNHLAVGEYQAGKRICKHIDNLLASFKGKKEDCKCLVVGAAGIDSPNEKFVVEGLYKALFISCPIFCMNDAAVALYAATKGEGVLAISGTGSIVIGRTGDGRVTRSGGYPTTIFGDEGSSRWIAQQALHYASQWVDGSIPASSLIKKIDRFFNGLDANKLVQCATALRRRPIDPCIAIFVYEAAREGDPAAVDILKCGAAELFCVAKTCVEKLGFDKTPGFKAGVWGSVLENNEIFFNEYKRLFQDAYPNSEVILPACDAADGAVMLAQDYLAGKVDFINDL
jgi:N-acetylglucosamine kinase-like BadF-type ATPase